MKDLKRNELPNFLELPYTFRVNKILKELESAQEKFDALVSPYGYGNLAKGFSGLEKIFGLKFNSVQEGLIYLKKNGIVSNINDKKNQMFIKDSDGSFRIKKRSPYKQMALTEYNPEFNPKKFNTRIPKDRLDERQYNKLKPWVIGTYLEEVILTFKGLATRVRVARMEPGCVIDEHIDYNTNYSIRIHIPLRTNDKCGFYIRRSDNLKKDYLKMPANGHCWFINSGYKHSAWNRGNTPRDHLVLSIVGQDDLFY